MKPRPILRYHGGKWKLAPWIISNFPEHRVYTEAYGGAASVLLRKPRSYGEVYNDLDGEIVNLFRIVRERGEELIQLLRLTPFSRADYKQSFDVSDDSLEQARRTVIRSFMGFGSNALCRSIQSGFRSNSNRLGTTPAHDWKNFPDSLKFVIERLQGVVIENRDALGLLRQHDSSETLHYCDPPYVHGTRSAKVHGHHGYTYEMTDEQHQEMISALCELKGAVVLSGYANDIYGPRLWSWRRVEIPALADGARKRTEILWIKAAA